MLLLAHERSPERRGEANWAAKWSGPLRQSLVPTTHMRRARPLRLRAPRKSSLGKRHPDNLSLVFCGRVREPEESDRTRRGRALPSYESAAASRLAPRDNLCSHRLIEL